MPLVPMVVEQTARGERSLHRLAHRLIWVVFLGGVVDEDTANLIVAQFVHLESDDPDKDIHLYINSPGKLDLRRACDLRHDAVHPPRRADDLLRDRDVDGVAAAPSAGRGQANGAAQQPDPDPISRRAASRASRPTSRSTPRRSSPRARIDEIYAKHTGQSIERVHADMERDRYFTGDEALAYGLVDRCWRDASSRTGHAGSAGARACLRLRFVGEETVSHSSPC